MKKIVDNQSIVLLCRGLSLNKFQPNDSLNTCGTVGIVNEWDNIIEQEPFVDYLQIRTLIHYVNRMSTAPLTKSVYQRMKVSYAQLNSRKDERCPNGNIALLKRMGIETKYLPEEIIPYSMGINAKKDAVRFPSTGALCVVHAATVLKMKRVVIFGIDFFEADYFSHHSHFADTSGVRKHQKEKGVIMKKFLLDFMKNQPDVQFEIFTYANLDDITLANLRINTHEA